MKMTNKDNNQRHKGFTLIEVLITMLIMAIGLLSLAALQVKGLQYSTDAGMRNRINVISYDIIERIRLNRTDAAHYIIATPYVLPATLPSCSETMGVDASNDLNCWQASLSQTLPPGSTVSIQEINNEYTISVGWAGRDGQSRTTEYTFLIM